MHYAWKGILLGTLLMSPALASAGPRHKDPTAILRRNIFDPTTGPLDGSRVADVAPNPNELTAPPVRFVISPAR